MKTLYYINGKQVDINTYYSVSISGNHAYLITKLIQVSLNLLQDFLMKRTWLHL
mgnify:CR=1 FL=1